MAISLLFTNSLSAKIRQSVKLLALCLLPIVLNGCSTAYKPTGQIMVGYSKDHAVNYALSLADSDMGCALGEAFSPFLFSFERTGVEVDHVAILMDTLSGFCAESRAWDEELRHLRAMYHGQTATAKDALTAYKRLINIAATRQYNGYQRLVSAFGEPSSTCPKFKSEDDEFYYLIGLVNGIQAVKNSITAGQDSDVSLDTATKVSRGAACLDENKWWGVPLALQATVWSMNPSIRPADKDPLAMLEQASTLGIEHNVRLSHVFHMEVLNSQSKQMAVRKIIAANATALNEQPAEPKLRLIDDIARRYLLNQSDKIWTIEKGYRTPIGQYGQFWQPKPKEPEDSGIEIDDLI